MKPKGFHFPALLALTSDDCGVSHARQTEILLDAGVKFIQLRSKSLSTKNFLMEARMAVKSAKQKGADLVINDAPRIAAESGADGVHLGMTDSSPGQARRLLSEGTMIGRTVHSLAEAHLVANEDCDYVGLGPYRRSQTKRELNPVLGQAQIQEILAVLHPLPVYLIGGLELTDFDLIGELGVTGLAVCSALSKGDAFGVNIEAFVERAQAFETMEVLS